MASVRANMEKTTSSFFKSYETLDADTILEPWADNCIHQIRPDSRGFKSRTKDEYRDYVKNMGWAMRNFKYIPDKGTFSYDAENRTAAFHAYGTAETAIGPFNNEFAFFLRFNETGDKITRVDEFVDSSYSSKFFDELMSVLKMGDESEVLREWKKKIGKA